MGFWDFSKAPDAVSHSDLLDKVSSWTCTKQLLKAQAPTANGATSTWGPVKAVLNFRVPDLVFYQLPGQSS